MDRELGRELIRHCVFLKFKSSVSEAERLAVFDALRALNGKIDGLVRADFGANVSPEALGKGFGHGFIMDFRDAKARDAYLVDPDHKAAGARLVAAAEGGMDGLLVFDMELA